MQRDELTSGDDSRPKRTSRWIVFGRRATFALILIVSLPMIWSLIASWPDAWERTCPDDIFAGRIYFLGSCLSLNELGDFLAGLFAPLAFVWLFVAVMIQSEELSAQHKELALTRDELSQQREVMKEQAAQARNQAKFIGEQTDILRREQDDRAREQADEEFASLVSQFLYWWRSEMRLTYPRLDSHPSDGTKTRPEKSSWTSDIPIVSRDLFKESEFLLSDLHAWVEAFLREKYHFRVLHSYNFQLWSNLLERCQMLLSMKERVSGPIQVRFVDARFDLVVAALEQISNASATDSDEIFHQYWNQIYGGGDPEDFPRLELLDFELFKSKKADWEKSVKISKKLARPQ